ncbi:MAG: hypothetical protein LBH26_06125, partial [Treponema sp.]|nr:hypothetical protein [Treponema sp.]
MRIKRGLAAVIAGLALFGKLNSFGQQRGPIDLILLLDTSASMSAYYQEVNGYLTGSFLRDNLRLGDTFHLVAFSGRPRMEIARRIEGRGDLETIIGRMLLMYPLESPPDIPAALSFAENYSLGLGSPRQKKIVFLSLGNGLDAGALEGLAAETRARLAGRNAGFEYLNPRNLPEPEPPRQPVAPQPATPTPQTPQRPATPPAQEAPQRPATPPAQPATQAPSAPQAPAPQAPRAPQQPATPAQPAPQHPATPPSQEAPQRPATPPAQPATPTPSAPQAPVPQAPRAPQQPATPAPQTSQRPAT